MPDFVRVPYLAAEPKLVIPLGRVVEPGEVVTMTTHQYKYNPLGQEHVWGADWGEPEPVKAKAEPKLTKKDGE